MPNMRILDHKGWRRVRRFEHAAINLSWKGGTHPDGWESIEREYQLAAKALLDHLNEQAQALVWAKNQSGRDPSVVF